MTPKDRPDLQTPRIGPAQIRLLGRLSEACGVSGDERDVRTIVAEELKRHADQITTDAIGNLIVSRPGAGKSRLRVMVAAHMDEVGFMLTQEDGEGIYRFELVGGLDVSQLAGKAIRVGRERVPGVIGTRAIHLTKADDLMRQIQLEALRIDLGTGGRNNVKVGDRATFATSFTRLGPSLRGKALDDRLGVATLIELVKHAPPNIDLLAAFTVQEEIGLRGAKVAAYALDPDLAIALDCTPAYDLPAWDGEENTRYNTRLGAGPAIYLADGGTLSDPRLVRHLVETAESLGIPYQFRQPGGGRTDAASIHRQRTGIPSISVSVPARYPHTAAAIARLSDWQHTLSLVYASLLHLTAKTFTGEL